jgi:hypothetical protein
LVKLLAATRGEFPAGGSSGGARALHVHLGCWQGKCEHMMVLLKVPCSFSDVHLHSRPLDRTIARGCVTSSAW